MSRELAMRGIVKRRKQIKKALAFKFHIPEKQISVNVHKQNPVCLTTEVSSLEVDVFITASLIGRNLKEAAIVTMDVFGMSACIRD